MTKIRTRVRLTAKDWGAIWVALRWIDGPKNGHDYGAVMGKIGVYGMAARDRGVAPVRKGTR